MTTIETSNKAPTESNESPPRSVAIPLAEFGKSLSDSDLNTWLEALAARNAQLGQEYEISNRGHLIIMVPTGLPGFLHEGELFIDLGIWTRQNGGVAFPSSSMVILPDGSRLGPDAAWISEERRHELRSVEQTPFPHLVPTFVAEVQSPSNTAQELANKINLFITHGTRLGWLIIADTRTVILFRPGQEPEVLVDPEFIDGDDDVLTGFRFAVRERIFDSPNNPQ